MVDTRQITISIPTFNRSDLTLKSFEKVYDDERVGEIVIVDDASDWGLFSDLKAQCDALSKVKLYRNITNKDCYENKMMAASFATNKWCIILDSDNVIDGSYLDKLYEVKEWDEHTIYAPDFAMPTFCYEQFSGMEITKENVSSLMDYPMFQTCLNTFNYFINRDNYLKIWDGSVDPVTSDSIYFNLKWLEAGYKIIIVNGLKYFHRIHDNSHYNSNNHRTPSGFHDSVVRRLKELR